MACLLVIHFALAGSAFAQESAISTDNPVQVPQGVEVLSNLVVQIESSLRAEVSVMVKYVLHAIDMRIEGSWQVRPVEWSSLTFCSLSLARVLMG